MKKAFMKRKSEIISYFSKNPYFILSYSEIARILHTNRYRWELPESTSINQFITFVIKYTSAEKIIIRFPHRKILRYVKGNFSIYHLTSSLLKKTYFTHLTALYLHKLILTKPKSIYVNYEQSPHTIRSSLSQKGINLAFSKPPRMSKNIALFKNHKIYLLNGKFTGSLGVTKIKVDQNYVYLTDLERTLIDITVRPQYSGGLNTIMKAYSKSKNTLSIATIIKYLKKIKYIYPYHQVIGFYCEKAGMSKMELAKFFDQFKFEYDFFLAPQMKNPKYSKKWKIFYPNTFH
jgi:predicted transcriptional regulator of viral defense system